MTPVNARRLQKMSKNAHFPERYVKNIVAFAALALSSVVSAAGLKDDYAGKFYVGAAIGPDIYRGDPTEETRIITAHFSTITPENEMKPERIHPDEGRYYWDDADRFVAFGVRNRMKIIGHCLVWHNQTPGWFFTNPDGTKADRKTLIRRMRAHIHAVVGRYKGRVHGWDVVNEAFDDEGNIHNSQWREGIGPDFIELAFRFAHEADPKAELYYNDFNMWNSRKADGVIEYARKLKAKGIRIDGIGLQSHGSSGWPAIADYERTIVAIGAAGMKAMVTELDVSVLPNAWGLTAEITTHHDYDEKFNPWKNGVLPPEKQQELTNRYVDLFTMYLKHADIVDRVTVWGISDKDTWLNNFPMPGRTDFPLLFDRSLNPKPCLEAIRRLGRSWKVSGNGAKQRKRTGDVKTSQKPRK
nr:xylanase [uncultured bacterium]